MRLLRALRCILCCGEDEDELHFHGYRNYRDYSPIISPSRSTPPKDHHTANSPQPLLPPARSMFDSRADAINKTRFSSMGSPTFSSPSVSSSIRTSSSPAPLPPARSLLDLKADATTVTPFAASMLSKLPSSSVSPSLKDTVSLPPPSKISSSTKPSPASISPANSSNSGASSKVLQVKLPIPADSGTRLAEKPSSSSPSPKPPSSYLPSSKSKPSPAPVSSTNISFSGDGMRVWREKKQTSMVPSSGSLQKLPALSPFPIKVPSPDDASSSSSSEAFSPLSSVEPPMRNRRVLPKYEIPKNLEEMIKKDIVPPVLHRSLSPSTYADYFATLLYAEDFYLEKWSKFLLEGVTLELRPKITSTNSQQISVKSKNNLLVKRGFVAFEVDSVPEKRPYLLSRDFVFLRPLNEIAGPFKGRIFRVPKSTVLAEFGDDFYSQHIPSKKYDVSFSFNRVCLKRAHQAISAAADPSFHRILFPDQSLASHNTINVYENKVHAQLAATRILNHKGPLPFLVEGPISVVMQRSVSDENDEHADLTITGVIIQEAILKIYRANPRCRILVCSPKNTTSDVLLRSLLKEIPDSRLFRANAAFRDYMLVPDDIIPASLYEDEEECFACPPLSELLNFNVITSTFMSSFRLCAAGIDTEHFTHIFLVDASLVIEPEAIVPLANLAGKNTVILVTGCLNKFPNWVRADIARRYGLKRSYFHRLQRK